MGHVIGESHGPSTAAHAWLEEDSAQDRVSRHEIAPFPHVSDGPPGQAATKQQVNQDVTAGVSLQSNRMARRRCIETKSSMESIFNASPSHSRSLSGWLHMTASDAISSALHALSDRTAATDRKSQASSKSQVSSVTGTSGISSLPHTLAAEKLVQDLKQAEEHEICVHTGMSNY